MSNQSLLLLLLLMPLLVSSFLVPFQRQSATVFSKLKDCELPWEGPVSDETLTKFKTEETLLHINCRAMHDTPLDRVVLPRVSHYVQSFFFKRVLPVQPLQTVPTTDGGVEVIFWKPAFDQSHVDGGMRFFLIPSYDSNGLQIVVKRKSEGQTCRKSATEKMVVQAFLRAFMGKDREQNFSVEVPPTYDVVTLESIFHQWMFSS